MRHAVFIASRGEALFEQGRTAEAEEQFRLSLQQAERITEGRPSLTAAQTLESLARVFRRKGQFSEARAHAQRAVEILEGMPRAPLDLAYALRTLALVARDLGEWDLAEKSLLRALELEEKYYGPGDNPSKLPGLAGLAEVFAFKGERQKALNFALRAERASSEFARLTARSLSEREALLFSATRTSAAGLVLTLATSPAAQSAWKQLAWDALIHSRALVLDEMAARHLSVGATEDAGVQMLQQKVREARERLARIWVRGPREEPEKYRKFLAQAQAEKDAAERALAEKSKTARAELARAAVGWQQVLSALPARSALVGFARYPHHDFSAGATSKPSEPVVSYLAFVLRNAETTPVTIPLGAAKEIEELIAQMRQQMAREARSQGRATRRNEAQFRAVAARLRRLLWDPLVPHLRGARRVFLVPDGALHLVDFAALPAGQQSYLIEIGPQIHYLSAERDLVSTEMPPAGNGILVVGDPAFDDAAALAGAPRATLAQVGAGTDAARATFRGTRSACGAFASLRFEPLRASAREAEEVLRVWSGENPAGETLQLRGPQPAAVPGSVLLRGAAASEAEFKRLAVGRRVLHLATHGFFLGRACESALAAEARPMESQGVAAGGENPLLHSGLALAGANRRQAAGAEDEDGILTAEEIAALDLNGTEWAVLSACDTGLGEVQAGEGVLGLRRAFQVAGVRTVIMSLWPVEDEAARQWMRRLYSARFVKNKTTAEAAQQASLEILRQRRARQQSTHPFYWAGFVAAGDWR
jgi:CHAT domain-containing protein